VLSASVASVAQIVPPEFLIRETELKSVLSFIANTHGHSQTTFADNVLDPVDLAFGRVYDQTLEDMAKAIRSTQKIMKFSGLAITLPEYDKLPSKSYIMYPHLCWRAV
jgi:hypothetical protein